MARAEGLISRRQFLEITKNAALLGALSLLLSSDTHKESLRQVDTPGQFFGFPPLNSDRKEPRSVTPNTVKIINADERRYLGADYELSERRQAYKFLASPGVDMELDINTIKGPVSTLYRQRHEYVTDATIGAIYNLRNAFGIESQHIYFERAMEHIMNWDATLDDKIVKIKVRIGNESIERSLRLGIAIFECTPGTIVASLPEEAAFEEYATQDIKAIQNIIWSSAFGDEANYKGRAYAKENIQNLQNMLTRHDALGFVPSGDSGEKIAGNLAAYRSSPPPFLVIGEDYLVDLESFGVDPMAGNAAATLIAGDIAATFAGLTQKRELVIPFLDHIVNENKIIKFGPTVANMRDILQERH
jgi:hypothetical protein